MIIVAGYFIDLNSIFQDTTWFMAFVGDALRTCTTLSWWNSLSCVGHGLRICAVEKLSSQLFDLIVMSHWLNEVWIRIRNRFVCFTFIFLSYGESCLLISWCAGGRCGMTYSDEDRSKSRRPAAEHRIWSHRSGTWWSGYREVGWRCVRSTPCTWRLGAWVFWLSLKTKVDGLLVIWPQNRSDGFSSV
jgi:hypothetical protein